jgi:hypothetical protein
MKTRRIVKRKSQTAIGCILILITTSCGTFNKSNIFNRQGKNKVIDRDFESAVQFEEADQIVETVDYEEFSQEPQLETINNENVSEATESTIETSINGEELFKATTDSTTTETVVEHSEEIESSTYVVSPNNETRTNKDSKVEVAIAIFLIVVFLVFAVFIVFAFNSIF